jgi:hypothetical protein
VKRAAWRKRRPGFLVLEEIGGGQHWTEAGMERPAPDATHIFAKGHHAVGKWNANWS